MMLLKIYAEEKGILEKKTARVIKVVPGNDSYTLHYRVDGQKYRSPTEVSKKTVSTAVYNKIEVDEKTGEFLNGRVILKNNFLVWEPEDLEDEA